MPFVVLDIGRGLVEAGGRGTAVRAMPGGRLSVGEDGSGAVLRPLSFGERSQAVRLAETAADPAGSLAAAVRSFATVGESGTYDVMHDVVALVLAGADAEEPVASMAYADVALLVARAAGWEPAAVRDADAVEVDSLAAYLLEPPGDDGWTRLDLAPETPESVVERLAAALLRRAMPGAVEGWTAWELPGAGHPAPATVAANGVARSAANGVAHDAPAAAARSATGAAGAGSRATDRATGGTPVATVPVVEAPAGAATREGGPGGSVPGRGVPVALREGVAPNGAAPDGGSSPGRVARARWRLGGVTDGAPVGMIGDPVGDAVGATGRQGSAPVLAPAGPGMAAATPFAPPSLVPLRAPEREPERAPVPADLLAATAVDEHALATRLARLLDDESDLRGLRP